MTHSLTPREKVQVQCSKCGGADIMLCDCSLPGRTALASGSGDHAELVLMANAALRESLTKANDGFEEYERKFYLEQDAREEAERKLAEAVGLLRVTLGDLDRRDVTAETANRIDHFISKEAERG